MKKTCATCVHAHERVIPPNIQKGYECRLDPPNIPMPGPGGQGVIFVQPVLGPDQGCSHHEPVPPTLAS